MGRIKTKLIKRYTKDILRQYGENFNEDFASNKETIVKYAEFPSKKLRNVISGYVTRQTRNKEQL